jgi:hypothetical protein
MSRPLRVPTATGANLFSKQYAELLDDPFSHEPIRLGFGTLVDTRISTARVTTTLTANATDGALLLAVGPNAQSPLAYSTALTGAVPSWGAVTDGAWTTVSTEFVAARPIALGVRVTPISSNNDKCCRVVGSLIPYDTENSSAQADTLNGYFHQTWYESHLGSKVILGSGGQSSSLNTWRPMSLKNFDFDGLFLIRNPAISTTRGFQAVGPAIVVAIVGPTSLQYDIEVLYHYEAIATPTANYAGMDSMSDKASDFFPSLEKFYSAASSYMNDDNVTRLVGVASYATQMWRKFRPQQNLIPYRPDFVFTSANVAQEHKDQDVEELDSQTPRSSVSGQRDLGESRTVSRPLTRSAGLRV